MNFFDDKNNAKGAVEKYRLEKGFYLLKFHNSENQPLRISRNISRNFIQFHFTGKGGSSFRFNDGAYTMQLEEEKSLLLYNPKRDLPLDLELAPTSWLISLIIGIDTFHGLFSEDAGQVSFLNIENRDKHYYKEQPLSPGMVIVLNQLEGQAVSKMVKKLYLTAKCCELLSLYFNRLSDPDVEQCPFLSDEENVLKIRKAKEIMIAQMSEPPSLPELAREIGLSLKKLKEGFKQVYGDSVFSFLFHHKMEYARRLLDTGEYNVNEVGHRLGYSTSSHFIAAFRKKFGTTPKKYLMSLTQDAAPDDFNSL